MRWRTAVTAAAVALAGCPVVAGAASPAKPPAKVCNLVVDPAHDTDYTSAGLDATDPDLDVVSADIGSDDDQVAVVFRVAELRPPAVPFTRAVYRFEFTVSGSDDRLYLAASGSSLGVEYEAGYLAGAAPGAEPAPVALGRVTGSMSAKTDEIRVSAPLSLFASRARIRRGAVLSGFRVMVWRTARYGPAPDAGEQLLVADEASSGRRYVATTPSCIGVGYCSPPTRHYVGGTARGEDGLDVNVQVSVVFLTAKGVTVGKDGCAVIGYGAALRLNSRTPATGTRHSARTTNTWRVDRLPANVTSIWVETYPLGPDGKTTKTKYGASMRRRLPLDRGDIAVRLPVVCSKRGRTGSISGYVVNQAGNPVPVDRVVAWSEAPESRGQILGWGVGTTHSRNRFDIPALADGQKYSVWVSKTGGRPAKVFHVPVRACRATPIRAIAR